MMASTSPLTEPPAYFQKLEFIFNVIFVIEMVLKITAFGLSEYLKDGWNLLDVIVVTTAWAPYIFPHMGNYSAIRAVRVLRALRTVNRIPSLRKIIETLLGSIPQVCTTTHHCTPLHVHDPRCCHSGSSSNCSGGGGGGSGGSSSSSSARVRT